MSNRSWSSFLLRFGLLVGVLAALGTALVWQRLTLARQAKQAQKALVERHIPPETIQFDQLAQERLAVARSKSATIAAQRKAIRGKSFMPDLSVPIIKGATTRRKYQDEFTRYRLRFVDDYRRLTKDSPTAKAAGELFLESFLRETSKMDFSGVDYEKLDQLGLAAIEAGSNDPLLRIYQVYAHWALTSDSAWAEREWQKILVRLRETTYPRRAHADLNRYLLEVVGKTQPHKRQEQSKAAAVATAQWLEEEGSDPEWRRCVSGRLWSFWTERDAEAQRLLLTECLGLKGVDEYLLHLMLGSYHLRLGWNQRGTAYAIDVPREQWAGFQKEAAIATDHLQYAWSLQPTLPYAPQTLISASLATSHSGESPHFWFLRTLETQFDYYDAYSMMLHTLLPRWGGSHDKMLSFARNCLGTDQFTTTVPYFVVDVLQRLESTEKLDLAQLPAAAALLRELIEKRNAFRARSPDAVLYEDDGAYHADLILLLEQCGLPSLAADEVIAAGENVFWNRLQTGNRPGRYLAQRLVASQGPDQLRVLEFDQRLRQPWSALTSDEELEWLTKEYEQLSQGPGAKKAEQYYRQADVILAQLRQFSEGDWVELPFSAAMNGWEPGCYHWYVHDDGSVDLNSSGLMGLRPLANFHPPLEVEATLDLTAPHAQRTPAGIAWFQDSADGPLQLQQKFLLGVQSADSLQRDNPRALQDMTVEYGLAAPSRFLDLPSSGPHRLTAKLWERYTEFTIDEIFVTASPPRQSLDQQGFLYFGTTKAVAGPLRWSSIRVRMLTEEDPPTPNQAYLDRKQYWEQRRADAPDDQSTVAPICQLLFEEGRFDELLALADRQQQHPQAVVLAYWKGRALLDQGNEAAALRALTDYANSEAATVEFHSLLAELYATANDPSVRDGQKALAQCGQALAGTNRRHAPALLLAASAASYAATGDFPSAIKYQQEALRLANEPEEIDWRHRLADYEAGRPYRRPPSKADAK